MKKTSLYIEEDVDAALGRLAEEEGISKAALIRRELANAAERAPAPRFIGIGIIKDGPPDLGSNDEYWLRKLGFGQD